MYNNIGGRLKVLSIIVMILDSIIGIIYGIILTKSNQTGLGFVVIVASPLLSWVASWILFGLGQVIEDVEYIKYQTYVSDAKQVSTAVNNEDTNVNHCPVPVSDHEEAIPVAVNKHNECYCPKCDKPLIFYTTMGTKKCEYCKTLLKPVKRKSIY